MTNRIQTSAFAIGATAVLAACSFNGPSDTKEGFATPNSQVGPGSEFSRQSVKRIVLVNGVRSFKDQNVRVALSSDGKTATIFLNNATYTLTQSSSDPDVYLGTNTAGLVGFNNSKDVQIVYFVYDDSLSASTGYENTGQFVVGYKTNPARVDRMTGTASYSGAVEADFFVGNTYEIGTGSFNMTADFAADSISGNLSLVDGDPGSSPNMPNIDIALNPGNLSNIAGNAFSGPITTTINTVGGDTATVTGGGLDGHFYGATAGSVGGTFWNTGTFNGQQMLLQGAFGSN